MSLVHIMPLLACAVWAGCTQREDSGGIAVVSPPEAAGRMQDAFAQAPPALRDNVSAAAEAMRKAEYERAVVALQAARNAGGINIDQGLAIHRSVVSMEAELIGRIEAGDTKAEAAYQLLKRMKRQ